MAISIPKNQLKVNKTVATVASFLIITVSTSKTHKLVFQKLSRTVKSLQALNFSSGQYGSCLSIYYLEGFLPLDS